MANTGRAPRLRLAFAASVILLASGCTGGTAASGPSSPSDQRSGPASTSAATTPAADAVLPGHVLFARTTAGDIQTIYVLTGGVERKITAPGAYGLGRLSPDHRHILVMPGGDIPPPITGGILDLDGNNFTRLKLQDPTLNLVPDAWSPDGTRISFEGWDDSDPSRTGAYTARASDGGDLVRVTIRPGGRHDVPIDYSPDGRWLLLYRSVGVDPDPHVGGSLWVVRVNGKDAHRINGQAHPADWARWSPDGRKILFATQRTAPSGAIWTVAPDGSHLSKLFVDPAGGFPITPSWSPDGSRILFALDPTNDEFTHPDNVLEVINADGTYLQQVIATPDCKRWPEWWN